MPILTKKRPQFLGPFDQFAFLGGFFLGGAFLFAAAFFLGAGFFAGLLTTKSLSG
jgi:hypothetical protein